MLQNDIEELGYDWLLSPGAIGGNPTLGGGTVGSGTPITDIGADGQTPVTAGLRSGVANQLGDNIDGVIEGGVSPDANTRAPGILSLAGVLGNDGSVTALLRGLNNKTGADQVVKKTVITRSGQSASVEVIREFIYPTEYEPPELPNSVGFLNNGDNDNNLNIGAGTTLGVFPVTPANPTAFDTEPVGCVLEVEPLVGQDRRTVELSVSPSLVEFDGFVNYGSPIQIGDTTITENTILQPVFSRTRVNTSVVAYDGATVVLGGLLQGTPRVSADKAPILGDIPFVGRFFQSNSATFERTALLVFVKVRLVDPAGQPINDG